MPVHRTLLRKLAKVADDTGGLTSSLSGRPPTFNKRRERTIVSRSRRSLVRCHGRSKRWLEGSLLNAQTNIGSTPMSFI